MADGAVVTLAAALGGAVVGGFCSLAGTMVSARLAERHEQVRARQAEVDAWIGAIDDRVRMALEYTAAHQELERLHVASDGEANPHFARSLEALEDRMGDLGKMVRGADGQGEAWLALVPVELFSHAHRAWMEVSMSALLADRKAVVGAARALRLATRAYVRSGRTERWEEYLSRVSG